MMVHFGKLTIIYFIFLLYPAILHAQEYAVNTYDLNTESGLKSVKTKIVNLDSKTITNEILISDWGYIINKKPAVFHRGNNSFLVSIVYKGCYCKNSIPSTHMSNISIVDSLSKDLIFSYSDSNILIHEFVQNDDNTIFIDGEIKFPERQLINGDYEFRNNWRVRLKNPRPNWYHPKKLLDLGRFKYYEPIDTLKQIYKANSAGKRYLLKTNNEVIFDSLGQNNDPERSIVFASKDSLVYVFHQNYEFYGEMFQKSRNEDRIESHALIYKVQDFSLVDSISIPDYPEGEYIMGDFGVADVVGDYIVHYFFHKGGLEGFEPAMLFIFDTRTNETTWLRVGWR